MQIALGFHDQPGGPQKGVAGQHTQARQHREGREPVQCAADIDAIGGFKPLDIGANNSTLGKRCYGRTTGKGPVPQITGSAGLEPEFKRHAPEDQPGQQKEHPNVQSRQEDGIHHREGRQKAGATEHQPGFVAVPYRRH